MKRYYTLAELQQLQSKLKANGGFGLEPGTVENLISQAIYDQTILRMFVSLSELMISSGSSWSDRIQDILNEYLFSNTDKEVINAAIALLSKHRNVSVDALLTRLSQFDQRTTLSTTHDTSR